jgi:hypothetical protein
MRRRAGDLSKDAGEMINTQVHMISQIGHGNVLNKVIFEPFDGTSNT